MKAKRPTVASLRAEVVRLKRLVADLDTVLAGHIRQTQATPRAEVKR